MKLMNLSLHLVYNKNILNIDYKKKTKIKTNIFFLLVLMQRIWVL